MLHSYSQLLTAKVNKPQIKTNTNMKDAAGDPA
jgi:hypothetical protein